MMATTDSTPECVERTREILSTAGDLAYGGPTCPVPPGADLKASDTALTTARAALGQALDRRTGSGCDPERMRLSALSMTAAAVHAEVKDALIRQRADAALGVRDAISALRNAKSTAALTQRAPIEARRIGFRRALFSRIEQGTWVARTAFSVDDPDFADELVEVGRANPRRLNGPLVESEMVRRCLPLVVTDPQENPRVHLELVRFTDTASYVAAPVLAWGTPVAMMHADRHTDSPVDDFDRYMLGTYSEALGLAIERNQMMERLQAVRQAASDYMAGVSAIADDFTAGVLESAGLGALTDMAPDQPQLMNIGSAGERLTPREWDVLRNMASGKTNAQIATGLFVSEGTVKSHVKHILRKLGATNRTEAVARYHRLSIQNGVKAG